MGPNQTFQQFLSSQNVQVSFLGFLVNIVLSILYAYLLSVLYVRYGSALSNRKRFAQNFVLITLTTMAIITIVKSSLALSLGLVGALSIVRFRTAIKEPEELSYLFICIAIGLGLGANQRLVITMAFAAAVAVIFVKFRTRRHSDAPEHVYFIVSHSGGNSQVTLSSILEVVHERCSAVNLKRFEQSSDNFEAFFEVQIGNAQNLEALANQLRERHKSLKVALLDNSGI